MTEDEARRDAEARSILSNTAYQAVADLGSKLATVALWLVLARELGDDAFGVFTFGFALAALLTTPANLGQNTILTREVARSRSLLREYFGNVVALRLLLAAPLLAAGLAVGFALGSDGRTLAVVALVGVAVLGEHVLATCFASYQAFERLAFVPAVLIPQRFLISLAGIAALLLGASVVVVAAVYAAATLVAVPYAIALLARRVERPGFRVDPGMWPRLMRAALPVGLAGVSATFLFRADIVLLGWFETDDVVGNYGAAHRLFESTAFLSWSVAGATYPVFARLSATSDPPVARAFERSLKLLLALTLPFAVGAALFAGPVVDVLYGSQFRDAETPLELLALAVAAYPVAYLAGYLLVARGRELSYGLTYAAVAIANVVANLVLIPLLSLDGAALAMGGAEVLLAASLLTLAVRTTGPVDWVRTAAGPALAASAEAIALVVLRDSTLVAIGVAGAVYVVTLAAFEQIAFPRDARQVWRFLRRA